MKTTQREIDHAETIRDMETGRTNDDKKVMT